MSHIIGYLRSGVNSHDTQSQIEQLKKSGATKIILEKPVDKKRDRHQLDKLMADVRSGDTLLVNSLVHIAQNTKHLQEIIESLNASGVTFKVIDNGIDTSTPHGEVLRLLLSVITNFQQQVMREKQTVGIERAKREGRYKGRKPSARVKTEEVLVLNAQGLTKQKIADQLDIGVASVYRILKNKAASVKTRKKPFKKTADKQKRLMCKPSRETYAEQLSLF